MKSFVLLVLAGFTSLVSTSKASALAARQASGTAAAPCAQVSQYMYGNGSTTVNQEIPAGLAMSCLASVPFNATSAKSLITSLRPYMNWQSTLDVLKNPPAEYAEKVQPPIDILGGLDKIDQYIATNRFKNEYDFGWTLYTLIQAAHDGHFAYIPDSVGSIFNWGRRVPLVSVSADGMQLPAVFAFIDVIGNQYKNISYEPSPVAKIDGVDTLDFLERLSQGGSLQDRDALYNNVFYELAQVSLGGSGSGTGMFTGGGRGRFVFPGDTTTLTFANGTKYTMQNYARAAVNFRGVTSGEELARKFNFGTADVANSLSEQKDTTIAPSTPSAPGYPSPIVAGPGNIINGFFVEVPGYEDVAVLQVPNFVSYDTYELLFQRTTQEFIPKALAAGKTKLILDVQANGGGTILQGYDLFKQLFPDMDPYGANRWRAHEAVDLIGKTYSKIASLGPRTGKGNVTLQNAQFPWFDYHTDMTVEGKPFSSWAEKYGPIDVKDNKYTTLARWNLSDVFTDQASGGINVTGYRSLANVTGPPKFKPENIVIVTDGYCASTCTIFTEFLTKQAGVKTIAMGGRSNKNPIQAIGGVKGVNNLGFKYIQDRASSALAWDKSLNTSILKQDYTSTLWNLRAASAGVNNRDGLRQNDTSGTALQFVYEEADCRLYYTPEMTVDITALWKAAADAQWKKSGKCVKAPKYGGRKREAQEVTKKLGRRKVTTQAAEVMMAQVEAFEDSFSLETDSHFISHDGFMAP